MAFTTWLYFLFGDADSIRQLAADAEALSAGFAFVLSAGLARNYARRDLLREPWWLALPLAASAATSLLLYSLFALWALCYEAPQPAFVIGYLSLLGLYWLAAPMAWLYGVPFERMFSRAGAIKARLATLGLVSVWRVALMIRVMYVMLDARDGIPFFLVMIFASAVALAAIALSWKTYSEASYPAVISLMGGLGSGQREETAAISTTAGCIVPLAALTLLSCSLVALERSRDVAAWQMKRFEQTADSTSLTGLFGFALASVAVWCALLPSALRKQRLRSNTESLFANREIASALRMMSEHEARRYPDQWEPPPAGRYKRTATGTLLLDVWEAILQQPVSMWVRSAYLAQLKEYATHPECYWPNDSDFTRLAAVLERIPEGSQLAATAVHAIDRLAEHLQMFDALEDTKPGGSEESEINEDDFISRPPKDSPQRQQALTLLRQLADRSDG